MRNIIYMVIGLIIAAWLPGKVINTLQTRENVTVFFDENRCPVQRVENKCSVTGNFTRNFLGDIEVTLLGGNVLLVKADDFRGWKADRNEVITYKGGRWFTGLLMFLSIAAGFVVALVLPALISDASRKNRHES